ncbi:MAG: SGNH/GDSL hydrolase family protein [Chitinispirillaceae bacterium]|nr:SGNH/GDSL hydrolase family protein [Chitinispirillaceae bacterium]
MINKSRAGMVLIMVMTTSLFAIRPNPLISRFKPIYASFSGSPAAIVNGKFGETAWTVTDSSWIAIKLDLGPSKILFAWNSTNYMWSDSIAKPTNCIEGLPLPVDYTLLISSNSTNGVDGDWKTVDSVVGNTVAARGHTISLANSFWVKMFVVKGGGKIDEVEIFDISKGNSDTWFFLGTSITANAFKGPVQTKNFSHCVIELVKDFNPDATPAFIRGGIGCATMAGIAADIDKIMQVAGNVKFFAVEVGTNDAWGGSADNLKSFTDNLQLLINACKARRIHPIIARIPATNPEKASWQINEGYLSAVDELTRKNNLVPGPDLYDWFLKHPDELKDDGIHPSPRGGANIQRLWAEAVYKLYRKGGKTAAK